MKTTRTNVIPSLASLSNLALLAGLLAVPQGGHADTTYVASYHDTILRFTTDGVGPIFATVDAPTFITIVPEPSTWATFGLGSTALLTLRRAVGVQHSGKR